MADAERGLGRPERALELAQSPQAERLDRNSRIEMLIVESGARADLGEHDAAVVVLQIPELDSAANSATLARLRFAYSEALERAAREREASVWRERAVRSDPEGIADLYAPIEEIEIVDLEEEEDEEDEIDGVEADGVEAGNIEAGTIEAESIEDKDVKDTTGDDD
jgi:hypothetical protein